MLYEVYRYGDYIDTVDGLDAQDAIDKAIGRWEDKEFGDEGARTDEDAKRLDWFLHAIFEAKKVESQ